MSERKSGDELFVESVKMGGDGASIYFSSGLKVFLSFDSYSHFRLLPNQVIDDEKFHRIIDQSEFDVSMKMALRKLTKEAYSTLAIREYLIGKGHNPDTVDKVVEQLKSSDLLDDADFAKTYAEDVADLKLLGRNRIIYHLRCQGISDDVIAELSFPEEKELDKAIRYGNSIDKKNSSAPYRKRKMKVHQALLARGFDEDVAHLASSKCVGEDDLEKRNNEFERQFAIAKAKYSRKYTGYELRQHIYAYLVRRGYDYDEVTAALEKEDL